MKRKSTVFLITLKLCSTTTNPENLMGSLTSSDAPAHDNTIESAGQTENDLDKLRKPAKVESHSSSRAIEQEFRELQLAHKRLQDELKRLQQQDFDARNKDEGESHHVVSAQFFDVFRLSTEWARDYFKIPFKAFKIDEHELFRKNLDAVLCGGCDWAKKEKMNVSHLVQAVVAEVLAREILLAQFAGFAESARHEFRQIYDAKLKENESKALKWRASTFTTYEQCEVWSPFDSSTPQVPTSDLRQAFYEGIAKHIDAIVGPIAQKHFPDRGDDGERFLRSMEFIQAAGNLTITLGKQAAKLVIMDKSWFERSKRVFVCNDDRMKGRLGEEYESEEFQVDIILRPGFLKYGNDEGENLENYAIWVPAMLDLSETSSYEDAKETANGDITDTQPEQLPPKLVNGGTAIIEPSSVEQVVALPGEDQLHPGASSPAEVVKAGTKPSNYLSPGEINKLHDRPQKSTKQASGDKKPRATRRRDVLLEPLKRFMSSVTSSKRKR